MNLSITSEITVTPAQMAKVFWSMGSDEQVAFFRELHTIVTTDYATNPKSCAWSLGEMQWYYVSDGLEKDKAARDMLMVIAAPLYLHTLRSVEAIS